MISQLKNKNAVKRRKKLLELSFRTIQRRKLLTKIIKVKQLERTKHLLGDTLYTWKLNARFSKKYKDFLGERKDILMLKSFKKWKKYASVREEKKRYQVNNSNRTKIVDLHSSIGKVCALLQAFHSKSRLQCF